MSKSRLLQPVVRRYLVIGDANKDGRIVSVEGPVVLKDVVREAIKGSYNGLRDEEDVTVFALTDGIPFKVSTVIERVETAE